MQTYLSERELSPLKQLWFILSRLGPLLWSTDKKALLITLFSNIGHQMVILPILYLDKLFIDTIVAHLGTPNLRPALEAITLIVLGRLAIGLFRNYMSRLAGNYNDILSRLFSTKIDLILADKYSHLDISTLEDPQFQDRFHKIEQEGSRRAYRLVSSFADFPGYISGVISTLSVFFFFQPLIALFAVIFLIPQFFVDAKFIRRRYRIVEELRTTQRINGWLGYYLTRAKSYLELRLLQAADYLITRYRSTNQVINDAWNKFSLDRINSRNLVILPQNIFSYSLDIYFAYSALIGRISLGTSQAYVRAIASFNDNLFNLVGSVLQFYENYLYVSDLVWFMELQPSPELSGHLELSKTPHTIEFSDVWFKYPRTEKFILSGVSFTISPKENVALVGLNGAGKTTLIKLLAGFYQPTRGRITIDGVDVTAYSKASLWGNLAVLFQDFEAYDFSAQESIGIGNPDHITDLDQIRHYAQQADVDDWIMSLPLQYQTSLSTSYDKGIRPSAGQWQRIGIARTLYKDAQILVLDEPTSNVDPQSEEEIFDHVLKIGQNKILIFISHRFNTVRRADKILVLENGQINEQGSHKQLIKHKGTYARLFRLQAKNYV